MPKPRKRNIVELTDEAASIISEMERKTGRTKKDLVSMVIAKAAIWGDASVALVYDAVPPAIAATDAFWEVAEREAVEGLRRCREKQGGG